ncbi:MAG: Kelch repeat-containing protein, partial [Planctomycetota bacterium]
STGTLTGGDVQIGAATTFAGSTATFGGLAETITAGAGNDEDWLVLCTFTAGNPGDNYSVSLVANGDVTAVGAVSTLAITPTGAPVTGNLMTVPGGPGPQLTITDLTPAGMRQITTIESDLVMLHLRFTAGASEGITVNSLTFHAQGTGDDFHDVSSVCFFRDMDTDGSLGRPNDTLLVPAAYGLTYAADDGALTFGSLSHTIGAGATEEYLLVYYMGGSGSGNYRATFDPSVDASAVGASSASPATIVGGPFIGPQVNISLNPGWTNTFPSAPMGFIGEHGHSAIYDATNHRIIIFGGVIGLNASNNDTWEIDLTVSPPTWTQVGVGPAPLPPNRHGHSAVFVPPVGGPGGGPKMWVFGGFNFNAGMVNDVWELDLTAGSEIWTQLAPGGSAPTGRGYHTAVWDLTNSRMVVYGGSAHNPPMFGSPSPRTLFNDVSTLDLASTTWTSIATGGSIPVGTGRAGHVAVYDDRAGRMVVFAGSDYTFQGNEIFRDDIYALDLSTWQWTTPSNTGTRPAHRYLHTAVADELGRRMFVFGGGQGVPAMGLVLYSDIFVYNLSDSGSSWGGGPWNVLSTSGGPPATRYNHASAFDPLGMRSYHVTGQNTNDAWDYK